MYGVCASGISMDRVTDDRGMLGLYNDVIGQPVVRVRNTDWSQWRYVVKVWCSESGTSGTMLSLRPKLWVLTGAYLGPPSRGYRVLFPHGKR